MAFLIDAQTETTLKQSVVEFILSIVRTCYTTLKSCVIITGDFVLHIVPSVVCIGVVLPGTSYKSAVQGVGVRPRIPLLVPPTRRWHTGTRATQCNEKCTCI